MDSSQLHLFVNHLPITSIIIGLLVLVFGLIFKKDEVKITSLGIFIFSGLTSLIAILTGEAAEQLAKKAGNFSETMIHLHEENSHIFIVVVLLLSITSIITYILHLKKVRNIVYLYFMILAVAISASLTGHFLNKTGRQIHHPEIRNPKNVIDVVSDHH